MSWLERWLCGCGWTLARIPRWTRKPRAGGPIRRGSTAPSEPWAPSLRTLRRDGSVSRHGSAGSATARPVSWWRRSVSRSSSSGPPLAARTRARSSGISSRRVATRQWRRTAVRAPWPFTWTTLRLASHRGGIRRRGKGCRGGPVWAAGRIVGVVAEHHPSEGTGRLTARRIDRLYEELSALDLGVLVELLGLAATASGLPDVVPVEQGQVVRSAYLAQVRDIAPDLLIGRESELAELAEFCAGADPYAWWQAGAWAGKSALASWFVIHPPAGADVVSFFITGRLYGQADSAAVLPDIIEQLNALYPAGGGSPAGARVGAWWDLLNWAAAQAGERARRLRSEERRGGGE